MTRKIALLLALFGVMFGAMVTPATAQPTGRIAEHSAAKACSYNRVGNDASNPGAFGMYPFYGAGFFVPRGAFSDSVYCSGDVHLLSFGAGTSGYLYVLNGSAWVAPNPEPGCMHGPGNYALPPNSAQPSKTFLVKWRNNTICAGL
jgi:hypothetical protein